MICFMYYKFVCTYEIHLENGKKNKQFAMRNKIIDIVKV